MINDIFGEIELGIGKALYADEGALWKRGKNLQYVGKKMQEAVDVVENWANQWGFLLSVAKTQVICFSKKKKTPEVKLKLYKQTLEQVSIIRYLGVWMDSKLTFGSHIQKLVDKCKKGVNVLRCLAGVDWGATRHSLKRVYSALIRSAIDYCRIVYGSASTSLLTKIEVIQNQALRICCGAFRSSPVTALQVEMGETPLDIREIHLKIIYWTGIKGHFTNHPVKKILESCWEYEQTYLNSFDWTVGKQA